MNTAHSGKKKAGTAMPARSRGQETSQLKPTSSQPLEGETMINARGNRAGTVQAPDTANTSGRVSTAELVDFVKEQALRRTIAEVSRLTGLSEKAVANIRQGLAGASAQTVSTWCRNDPLFRAEYFFWVGGHIEGCRDPDAIAGLTIALNSYARRLHENGLPRPRRGETRQ